MKLQPFCSRVSNRFAKFRSFPRFFNSPESPEYRGKSPEILQVPGLAEKTACVSGGTGALLAMSEQTDSKGRPGISNDLPGRVRI